MRAADALGLLAGLGALSALRGGREGTGKRFTGLIDMLDGGGAGASGDRFEGGGLLSMLGNLFAKPIEAQDNVERIAADASATRALTDAIKPQPNFPNYAPPSVSSMVGSGRGDFGMPMPPQNYESTAEQMQRSEFMGQFAQPQRYESTAEQMQRAEFPMINQDTSLLDARPIRPREEALPAGLAVPVAASRLFPPSFEEIAPSVQQPAGIMMNRQQFEDFIIPKYVAEYARQPSTQELDMAYNRYMSNMDIANNSTNDDNTPPVNQELALSLEDLRALKEYRRQLDVDDPNTMTSIAAENPFNPMAQYSTVKFGNVDLMQIASMLQRGANREGLVANFGADAVREAESMLIDPFYHSIGQLPLGMGGQFGTLSKGELRQRPIKSYRDPSQSTYNTGLLQ